MAFVRRFYCTWNCVEEWALSWYKGNWFYIGVCWYSFFLLLNIRARWLMTLCLPAYTSVGSEAIMLLIGTKLDLVDSRPGTRQVTTEEAKSFASSKHLIDALETSAKENTNVERTFLRIARALVKKHEGVSSYMDPEDSISLTTKSLAHDNQCWCWFCFCEWVEDFVFFPFILYIFF